MNGMNRIICFQFWTKEIPEALLKKFVCPSFTLVCSNLP
jgi:hypothetical protein